MGRLYNSDVVIGSYTVGVAAPIDSRMVVENVADLSNYSTFTTTHYIGMTVNVVEDGSVYMLTSAPTGSTISIKKNWATQAVWKKIGSDFDPSELGARTVSSVEALDEIPFKYDGAFAVVNGSDSDSENGLYVYNKEMGWTLVLPSTPQTSQAVASVVDSLDTADVPEGSIVTLKDTNEVYVLTNKENNTWEKISFNPEEYVDYYTNNLAEILKAKIVNDVEELFSLEDTYDGMFGVVRDNPDTSEDEGGLYVLTNKDNNTWQKITSGTSTGSTDHVITTDGTIPTSTSGISINKNDVNAYIEEDYVDNDHEFVANKYYTSRGLGSASSNGGELTDEESITLYADDSMGSFIQLYAPSNDNWIRIKITDDTLGLSKDDITYLDENDKVCHMESDELVLPKETPISFGKDFSFRGLKEMRGTTTGYVFDGNGSKYEDVDIYSSKVLPTVYAYAEGEPVKILTDGDKTEIITLIEEIEPDRISEGEILGLFED